MRKEDISQHKYLFHRGENYRAYQFFGAHPVKSGDKETWVFRVWAPRAAAVSVTGSWNGWDINADPMHRLEDDGSIWELVSDRVREGDLYKFAVKTDSGRVVYKADPYTFTTEATPFSEGGQRASRVWDFEKEFIWYDDEYIKARNSRNPYTSPMNIYEVHAGTWKRREDGTVYNYRELADLLIPYVVDMGYTHIEFLPVMEHPFDGSWGYQVTGYYSVTSRYGEPGDLKYLIDKAHRAGIGVILDWVPAHFPKDEQGLAAFDGYPLYEYTDELKREHKGWGTLAFDYGRPEVVSFLISNAFFYLTKFHADGLRVDAVSAMLYLNYGRNDGEWRPNEDGGAENKEAIAFLQKLNKTVLSECPGVLMIAEEATAFPLVTRPPDIGGLGFNFKWNMGWMNDTLKYFETDPVFRKSVHNKMNFAMMYAYSENFILPISHDEVVHGKKSLLSKMPGGYDDQFAGFRAFMVFMMTHPGKKLNFMGSEFAQYIEWNENQQLDWLLLMYEKHKMSQGFVKALNHLYLETPAMWLQDTAPEGFRWVDADNSSDNVFTYLRMQADPKKKPGSCPTYLIVLNLSGNDYRNFWVGVPGRAGRDKYECVIHTEDTEFGGTAFGSIRDGQPDKNARYDFKEGTGTVYNIEKGAINGYGQHISIALPKLSALILRRVNAKRQTGGTGKVSNNKK